MEISSEIESQIQQLDEKFKNIDQKTQTHLDGLLWAKPITYWDYIQTDALLNLQIQRQSHLPAALNKLHPFLWLQCTDRILILTFSVV